MRGLGKQARKGEESRQGRHRKVSFPWVISRLCGVSLPVRDSPSFLPLLRCYFIYSLLHLEAGQVFFHTKSSLSSGHSKGATVQWGVCTSSPHGWLQTPILHPPLGSALNSTELFLVFPPHLSEDTSWWSPLPPSFLHPREGKIWS